MLHVDTVRFGPLELDESSVVAVPEGLPGFPRLRRVTLLGAGAVPGHEPLVDQHAMFWMQDLDEPALAFMCIQPWVPFPDYDVEIDERALGITDPDGVCLLALVTVRRADGRMTMTANLRAPLVLDAAARRLHQVILTDGSWSVAEPFATTEPAEATSVGVG